MGPPVMELLPKHVFGKWAGGTKKPTAGIAVKAAVVTVHKIIHFGPQGDDRDEAR